MTGWHGWKADQMIFYTDTMKWPSVRWRDIEEAMAETLGVTREAGLKVTGLGEALGAVGAGVEWPSDEARAWVCAQGNGEVERAERTVEGFWAETKAGRPGFVGGFGRGGRRPSAVVSPRMVKVRLGEGRWGWASEDSTGPVRVAQASRGVRQDVPEWVLGAEKTVGLAVAKAVEWEEAQIALGHRGPVTLPGMTLEGEGGTLTAQETTDWECAACGAVSADEELFRESGCL